MFILGLGAPEPYPGWKRQNQPNQSRVGTGRPSSVLIRCFWMVRTEFPPKYRPEQLKSFLNAKWHLRSSKASRIEPNMEFQNLTVPFARKIVTTTPRTHFIPKNTYRRPSQLSSIENRFTEHREKYCTNLWHKNDTFCRSDQYSAFRNLADWLVRLSLLIVSKRGSGKATTGRFRA